MLKETAVPTCASVALLAEGVDRNISHLPSLRRSRVALLAEGVDRNSDMVNVIPKRASATGSS